MLKRAKITESIVLQYMQLVVDKTLQFIIKLLSNYYLTMVIY